MGRVERSVTRQRLTQWTCAEVDGATDAFGVAVDATAFFAATTSTSGRGVNGGDGTSAVAGVTLSFQ